MRSNAAWESSRILGTTKFRRCLRKPNQNAHPPYFLCDMNSDNAEQMLDATVEWMDRYLKPSGASSVPENCRSQIGAAQKIGR